MADTAALRQLACKPLPDVLDDLCMRFVNNLPDSEYESFDRLFFAIESAHWFYEDFYRDHNSSLPRLQLKEFAARLFEHSPVLRPHLEYVDALTSQFKSYKQGVPTCGAALLTPDMSRVLLVQGWGKGAKWGFPKGKIGKDETELDAAIREVYEETGYDFSAVLPSGPDTELYFIDSYVSSRLCRIYVVPGVPEDTVFKTQTRKEIAQIAWVPVSELPTPRPKAEMPVNSKYVRLVAQYVPKLRSWIKRHKKQAGLPTSQEMSPQHQQQRQSRSGDALVIEKKTRTTCFSVAAVSRDVDTFGGDCNNIGGSGAIITNRERNELFRAYVAEADKRSAELGLRDESWPVPILMSKDLGPLLQQSPPRQQRQRQHQQQQQQQQPRWKVPRRGKKQARTSTVSKPSPVLVPAPCHPAVGRAVTEVGLHFVFDRDLIMACFA
jgi:8-oxo-dGTP pyrophosphatase MutT (NUDIX family)